MERIFGNKIRETIEIIRDWRNEEDDECGDENHLGCQKCADLNEPECVPTNQPI